MLALAEVKIEYVLKEPFGFLITKIAIAISIKLMVEELDVLHASLQLLLANLLYALLIVFKYQRKQHALEEEESKNEVAPEEEG